MRSEELAKARSAFLDAKTRSPAAAALYANRQTALLCVFQRVLAKRCRRKRPQSNALLSLGYSPGEGGLPQMLEVAF